MTETARLYGKTALVTGAGQGVGRGIALALAGEGATVVVAGRTESKLRTVAEEIAARGARAHVVTGDVGRREDVERMVAESVSASGGLDILVNNAQTSVQRLLKDTTAEDVDLAYRSGPLATFHAMLAALPHLRVNGGSVVNLGSSTAVLGDPGFGSYAMAKEAIRGLTRVAAREWGAYGVRVNTICPAASSPAADEYLQARPERLARLTAEFPLGRLGEPVNDIGRAVAALVSDDMAYLTGATLMLDGGRTIIS
ncbi:SDR family oxidoreductase [Yinghuangia sp. ASG 101]|uniref:SDR family NAD(P)-dependent oxidoreductase n=1 Tax=Yinghuangia sp. ASG 101 TaxID=2896848 RepID=UPI001E505E1A|nr:SDR family oxidoreductase [Yinghuangia sp. ASG 101]UGQ11260.1 SDR family oxidoreductase [Yinghuangia sp. ASG 101]